MKKWIWNVCIFALALSLTACGSEVFEDNQVYIVEQGGKLEEDTVVGWLDIHAAVPFASENCYQQQVQFQMVEHNQRWYVLHFKAGEIGEEY